MTTKIPLSNIVENLEYIQGMDSYLHIQTGEIIAFIEGYDWDVAYTEEEIAQFDAAEQETFRTAQAMEAAPLDYIAFPTKYDINEYGMMENFCESLLEERVKADLLNNLKGSGVFRRFRNQLNRYGLAQQWYHFRDRALYEIAADWCTKNNIPYVDDRPKKKKSIQAISREQIMQDWGKNAERKSEQNFSFLTSLKAKTASRVDAIAKAMHQEAFEKIDCLKCGNCCKKLQPEFIPEDFTRISTFLNITEEQLKADYLELNDEDTWEFNAEPCPFLGADNKCSIYVARPKACRGYPHTEEPEFASRRFLHQENTVDCPAVYYIVERMKEQLQ